jgi:hypothetical protein
MWWLGHTGLERHNFDSSGSRACLEPVLQRVLGVCRAESFNGRAPADRRPVGIADEAGRRASDMDQRWDVETWLVNDEFRSTVKTVVSTKTSLWLVGTSGQARMPVPQKDGLERKRTTELEPLTFCWQAPTSATRYYGRPLSLRFATAPGGGAPMGARDGLLKVGA